MYWLWKEHYVAGVKTLSLFLTDVCREKALMALERALRELLNVRPPYARLVAQLLSFGPICHNVWGKWYRAAQRGARMHLWQAQFVTGGKRPIFGSSGQFRSSAATLDGKSGPACFLPRAKVTALCESDQRFLTGNISNSHRPLTQGWSSLWKGANLKLNFSVEPLEDFLIYSVGCNISCCNLCLVIVQSWNDLWGNMENGDMGWQIQICT